MRLDGWGQTLGFHLEPNIDSVPKRHRLQEHPAWSDPLLLPGVPPSLGNK